MSISRHPSIITLPENGGKTENLLNYLIKKFPHIDKDSWIARIQQKKIHWLNGEYITLKTTYIPGQQLCYYREVTKEPIIPFSHQILYQDDFILVAFKPHFLPVTPGGKYVNECLLERLRQQTGIDDLAPLHRLDRLTAGLVLFSVNKNYRGLYAQLFANQQIIKSYQAIAVLSAKIGDNNEQQHWNVANRLEKGLPSFIMREVYGPVNARSTIELVKTQAPYGLFKLKPVTGKTHQLRLHMAKIGMPILNDNFYPDLQQEKKPDFTKPLKLLAKSLSFTDPVSNIPHHFESPESLSI